MQGARLVGENLKSDFDILKHVVVFKKAGGVAGPVEILHIGAIQAGFGIVTFLNLLALLSLSFFVINLFPVPPLDGGAIAIALFESAIGRQINRQVEIMVTKVVLSIFVGLLVFNVLSALAKKLI
jgi:regulator of sigma E protease